MSHQMELEKKAKELIELNGSLAERDRLLVEEKQALSTKLKSSEEGFAREKIGFVSNTIIWLC
jgi:hypothetical protein